MNMNELGKDIKINFRDDFFNKFENNFDNNAKYIFTDDGYSKLIDSIWLNLGPMLSRILNARSYDIKDE